MNKSPQYKQQAEPKQCKSEAEDIYIHQKLTRQQQLWSEVYLKIYIGFHTRQNPSEVTISESSQIKQLHEKINL